MADPKTLKFQFVVDEASLQKTRQLIRELTADLAKLNEAAGKAGFGGGGLGGGAGGGNPGVNVTGGSRSPEQQRVLAKTAPAGRQLVQNFLDQKQIFKGIADGSKDSMRVMTDALKRAVGEQRQEVQKLKQALDALESSYQRLGGVSSGAVGQKIQSRAVQVQGRIARAQGRLGDLESMGGGGGELMPEVPWPSGPGPSRWQRIKGALGQQVQIPGLNKMMGPGTVAGSIAGRLGVTPAMAGSLGLGAVGAWGMSNIGNQVLNSPFFQGRSDAAWGQTFGTRGLDVRGGEFRNTAALTNIYRDQNKRQDYEAMNSGWRRFGHGAKAFITGDFAGAFSGRASDLAVQRNREEQIQNERRADPVADQILGEAQDYMGTIGTMRSLAASPKQGETGYQAMARIRAQDPTYTLAERAGMRGTLAQAGTRGAAWGMVGGALRGETAGIHGLGGAAGTMSKFGTGGVPFINTLRSLTGGGMDASTAGILGQFVSAQQNQLGVDTGAGAGTFQGAGLLHMLGAGTAGSGGRLAAEQNIRGAGWLQKSVGGQTSPYQAARNQMIAMESAPGASIYTQSALGRRMSLTELADAAEGKGGDVSAMFRAGGGTKEMAAKYLRGHTKSLTEGLSADALGGNTKKLYQAMGSEDPGAFFKSGKWKKIGMKEDDAVAAYADLLRTSNPGMEDAEAMGTARSISGLGARAKSGAGRAGGPGMKEAEMAAAHLEALAKGAIRATSELNNLAEAAKMSRLQEEMAAAGVNIKENGAARMGRWEESMRQAMSRHGDAATPAQVKAIMAELDAADTKANKTRVQEDETRAEGTYQTW